MSRIGKYPVSIPSGVEVKIDGTKVAIKGGKGSSTHEMPSCIKAEVVDGSIVLTVASEVPEAKALWGLNRVLLANMVEGVSKGFQKTLEIVGVGYKAEMVGKDVKLTVGLSHTVTMPAPSGITFRLDGPTKVVVEGIDKQLVGQIAAKIRDVRPPEPYKGKGIRYLDEPIRRKAGKATVK